MRPGKRGFHSIVLHTHLPYVHHPEYVDFLEEDWLFEAMTESYLPLLSAFRSLEKDGIGFKISFTLTPPILEMLRTPDLLVKFERFIEKRLDLAEKETERLRDDATLRPVAQHYARRFRGIRDLFSDLGRDVVAEFARLEDKGHVETLASAATHAFLPTLATDAGRRIQIRVGLAAYERAFGRRARGFWLPECAYMPGLDRILAGEGVGHVILDTHGLLSADPAPPGGVRLPIRLPSGVVAFGRDQESSAQVWSRSSGYPGDPAYRELYRDLGYDGDYDHVRPYLKPDGIRRNVGIKYHRVTGKVELHEKLPYDPAAAAERARVHAGDFFLKRGEQIKGAAEELRTIPSILSPYDTELFGHWWYEGPLFIESYFREAARHPESPVELGTPSSVIAEPVAVHDAYAHLSTWGQAGYAHVWLNPKNDWMIRPAHEIEERMLAIARERPAPRAALERRLLDQMVREVLLAQSSDWAFILTMETSVHYAEKRFKEHVRRFLDLEEQLRKGAIDEPALAKLEAGDAIFATLPLFEIARGCVQV